MKVRYCCQHTNKSCQKLYRRHRRWPLTFLSVSYLHQTHHRVKASTTIHRSDIISRTERHSSEGQGLRHGQSRQQQTHSYLKHVCRMHSYAFTPLHPRLYLASFPATPRAKEHRGDCLPISARIYMVTLKVLEALTLTFLLCGNFI